MKKFVDRYKERFHNRGNSTYVGLKIAGLVAMAALVIFLIVQIVNETGFGLSHGWLGG